MTKRCWSRLFAVVFLFAVTVFAAGTVAEANIPNVSLDTLQVESYYDKLREAFYQDGYVEVGACNGWVERVINKSGLIGEITVPGTTVLELNDTLKSSKYCTLVASLEGGQSDYQEATDQMIRDVNDGKIKAGDIVIYTKNMNDPENTPNPHWLHAAIVMKDLYDGSADNFYNYALTRWKEEYIGYPTIAHALAEQFGVEYYSPMTSPSSNESMDDGSTGYYVYRLEPEKYQEDLKKAKEEKKTEAKSEKVQPKTTQQPVTPSTESSQPAEESGESSVSGEKQSVSGGTSTGTFGSVVSILAVLCAAILLLLCLLLL